MDGGESYALTLSVGMKPRVRRISTRNSGIQMLTIKNMSASDRNSRRSTFSHDRCLLSVYDHVEPSGRNFEAKFCLGDVDDNL